MVIKAKNWKEAEDTTLVRAWMAIAQDPVTGNEQRAEHFWDRVHAEFSAHLPSGATITQKLADAHTLYLQDRGKPFKHVTSWELLKDCQKWRDFIDPSKESLKRSRPNENESQGTSSTQSNVSNSAELSENNSSDPIGRRGANYQARQAEIDTSIAKSSAKLAVIAEKKIVALEKLAESQRLAANNQIMCTNVEFLDEVARDYFMLQKRRILRDLRQQEQEIELAQAITMAMDPELISLADEDADAPSVALEEDFEGV
uniref:AlNc14C540G12099 protein n=1 Tax=Albugo laibachii Nc14 TaxID=890382 RepID=F0X112_9STRA|nr:AlNc14C540G12099 [Albugo laibachii Nc14]|eukprot:CCA27460.1 AlNc14C540G12099 [Albugo laibachii Nc14]